VTPQGARQSGFAQALLDPARPVPEGVVSHRGDSDPRRFAVYRNNVHVGLVGVLRAKYPVCARLVGEDFFTAMARTYVADHKPSSPIMMHYGADFAAFVRTFDPARSLPYLPDVAALEEAWSIAYNAADDRPAQIAEIAAAGADALPRLRLRAHPAATLVSSDFPVGTIWSAHQAEAVAPVRGGAEAVLVTRPHADVTVTVIPAADAVLVQNLFAGADIGDAAERALDVAPEFDFGRALVGLCALGAFRPPHEERR